MEKIVQLMSDGYYIYKQMASGEWYCFDNEMTKKIIDYSNITRHVMEE